MQKYYFSENSVNLSSILNQAFIKTPILREKPFYFKGDDMCLELVLSELEKANLKAENSFFIYENALPLSRVRMIIFDSKAQLETTINSNEISSAFILKDLCVVAENCEKIERISPEISPLNEDKIKEFDRYLGAMAFLRYKAQGDEISPFIFECLNAIINKTPPFEGFDKIKVILEDKLTADKLREYAQKNGLKYKENELNRAFRQDDEMLNILAQIWYYCGDGASKNLNDLLQIKPFKMPPEREFYFALGYFVGYSGFAKSELNKKLKFEFNKFELKIIEMIFNAVFDRATPSDILSFIDESRIFTPHFASELFDGGDEIQRLFITLYNDSVSFAKERENAFRREILDLKEQNLKLNSQINSDIKILRERILNLSNENSNLKARIFALESKTPKAPANYNNTHKA